MNQPHMDKNRMAALLDGRLSERDRDDAVAHLSASGDDAELFADAAAILRELEAQDGVAADDVAADDPALAPHPHANDPDTGSDGKVVPFRPPSVAGTRPRRMPARWLALAAVLAGVLLVPLALSRSGSRGPAGAGDYAVLISGRGQGLPAGWIDESRWSVSRGVGGGQPVVDEGSSARLGALHVDLALAIQARQQTEITRLVAQIQDLLVDVPASGIVIPYYRDISAPGGEDPADALEEAEEAVTGFVNADYFAAGAWAEAARLAAARQDAAFFRSNASRTAMDRVAALDADSRAAVDAIRAASPDGTPDWSALAAASGALLRHLAR